MLPEIIQISCPNCSSKDLKKSGIKKNLLQKFQKYQCKDCKKIFTLKTQTSKTYPINIILNSLSYYNLGYSQNQISKLINKKFKLKPSQKTISNWINEYKHLLPFHKLRNQKNYKPENIIESHTFLHNNLPYKFQIHKAKLKLLEKNKFINQKISIRIKDYLEKIPTKKFPHHIFKPEHLVENKSDRSSQIKFSTLKFLKKEKYNLANKLANLALNLANSNKQRHEVIQKFMLINDSTTIATEIPVYLTQDDLLYFLSRGFSINPKEYKTPITGHIDFLQIRNNLIYILDYKPEASKINPIEQLTIYALALASKTKLPLNSFKCAWFDEKNYYEFFPLHVIYKKPSKIRLLKSSIK